MPNTYWLLLVIPAAMAVVRYLSWKRDGRVARLRDEWGKPLDRWRDIEAISEYHKGKAEGADPSAYLDDRTWADLHMDLVFKEVDRTRSSIGNQLLYHRLRSAPSPEELGRFERLIQHFGSREEERWDAQLLLSRLSHSAGYKLWSICRKEGVPTHWWYGLFPALALAVVGSAVAIPLWPRAFLVLLGLVGTNVALRVSLAFRVFHLLGPFKEIGALLKCAKEVLSDSVVAEILGATQIDADLRAVSSLETTARWASRNSSTENEVAGVVYEYLNLFFMVDANAVLLATRTLRRSGPALLRIIEALGEVDVAISTASLRAGQSAWTIPEFTEPGSPIKLTDAWHPLIEDAVANSVVMKPGRGLIITGSNMSGKSTFLRTVGVTVVLAQTLNTCPARAYSSPPLRVRSAIGRSDDLTAGKSYYLVEVEAVLDLLQVSRSSQQHLFLFDELFRGTNTVERLSAGEAVLKALPLDAGEQRRHVVIAATHDGELVQMLEDSYDPYCFEETIEPDGLSFGYVLKPGPARTRSAIALLEINGAPANIVEQARKRAAELDALRGGS
jgi:MutS domain V